MPSPSNEVVLKFEDVTVHYGVIQAIHGITFDVRKGEIVTLIGANGAGKTTTLRAVSGLVRPSKGRVTYKGEVISGQPPHLIVRKRICQAPEGRGIFANLTVLENLEMGAYLSKDKGRIGLAITGTRSCTVASRTTPTPNTGSATSAGSRFSEICSRRRRSF